MPRTTRAALRAENIHIDGSATAESAPEETVTAAADIRADSRAEQQQTREPLGEIAPNAVDETVAVLAAVQEIANTKKGRSSKAKGGKKGAKKAKDRVASVSVAVNSAAGVVVVPDDRSVTASPASDAAVEELRRDLAESSKNDMVSEDRSVSPASPASPAVQSTQKELCSESAAHDLQDTERPMMDSNEDISRDEKNEEQDLASSMKGEADPKQSSEFPSLSQADTNGSPPDAASPSSESQKAEGLRIMVEPQGTTSDQGKSGVASRPSLRPEDSIEAIDALEEAIEEVDKALPSLKALVSPDALPNANGSAQTMGTNGRKLAKAPASRPQSAKRPVKAAERNIEAKKPAVKPAVPPKVPSSTQRSVPKRSTSKRAGSSTPASGASAPAKPVQDYLAQRRRPISMSFPAPPSPPKSSKPPSKPTFRLPGEAIAEKARAQREERLKQEAEALAAKREFKARPVPKTSSAEAPIVVKGNAASRARESLMRGQPETSAEHKDGVQLNAGKRISSIILPSENKRTSTITASKRASSVSLKPGADFASTSGIAAKRHVSSAASGSRSSSFGVKTNISNPAPGGKPTVTAVDVNTQRGKGREIFNRDRMEKEEREQERRNKEEAAKKARVEAAERGRQASREWAERQRQKGLAKAKEVEARSNDAGTV